MTKILTVGNFPVSWGYGATVQYKNIAWGLIENSCECIHICDYPNGTDQKISDADEKLWEKAKLVEVYPSGSRFSSSRFIRKCQRIIFRLPMLIQTLWNIHKYKCDIVILFGCYPLLGFLIRFCMGKAVYCLKGEYPLYGQRVRWYNFLTLMNELLFGYRFVNGMIVMTSNLKEYYAKISSSRCRFMLMPVIVDVGKFDRLVKNLSDSNYITYCGDFGGNKDGVCNLLESFIMIADKFPNIKLKLIGSTTELHTLEKLKDIVRKAGLTERVLFTGRLPHDQVMQHLKNSYVLALARPANKQAEGGFPSKLGEYLSTGNPAVITAVGEIPLYLKDNVDAFLVKPDDNVAFAEKLAYVLSDRQIAETVGTVGKKLADETFDYKAAVKKMLDFMNIK